MFWKVVEHPRTAFIVGLILGGIGIVAPFVGALAWAVVLWTLAALLIFRSLLSWEPLRNGLPWEFRSPIVQKRPVIKPNPVVLGERGLWDFRRVGDRAMGEMNTLLLRLGREMDRGNKRVMAHAQRMAAAAKRKPDVEESYKLSAKAGADIEKYAKTLQGVVDRYHKARVDMIQNYSDWFNGILAGTNLGDWPDTLRQIAASAKLAANSTEGWRQSVVELRNQNTSRPMNQACDRLSGVLAQLEQDINATEEFCKVSLLLFDSKGNKNAASALARPE